MLLKPQKRRFLTGLLFVSPALIGFCAFALYPIASSVYYSFCSYSVLQPAIFIGLENYREMGSDEVFWQALRNTLYYAGFAVPAGLVMSLSTAVLLNTKVRGLTVYRTVFFLPSLVPIVANSILWKWIFNGEHGVLNYFLKSAMTDPPGWLTDPRWSKPALIIMSLWGIGHAVVIYLAALQDVPTTLYEAAEIDGASWMRRLWNVTLPMISPVIYFNFIMSIIASLQVFTQAYVMTQGGPLRSTNFYALYIYTTAFRDLRMGYACAMAWMLFAIIVALTLLAMRATRRLVYYAAG